MSSSRELDNREKGWKRDRDDRERRNERVEEEQEKERKKISNSKLYVKECGKSRG